MRRLRIDEAKLSISELYELLFTTLNTMDQIFEFWLTASFAVIVASHFMAGRMTRGLGVLMTSIYILFSAFLALRYSIVALKMVETRDRLVALGESYPGVLPDVAGALLFPVFFIGVVGVVLFVRQAYDPVVKKP